MKKSHKNVNLDGKKSQTSDKSHKNVNLGTCELMNLNSQLSKFSVNITKSRYLDQDSGDGLGPNHYHCVEIHQSAPAQFDHILHEISNRVDGCWWTWTTLCGT